MKILILKNLMAVPWAWLGLMLFFALGICKAQDPKQETLKLKSKNYKAIILLASGDKVKGRLESLSDSSIYLKSKTAISEINYKNVQAIRVRRAGAIPSGAVIGAGAGLLVSLILSQGETTKISGTGVDEVANTARTLVLAGLGCVVGASVAATTAMRFKTEGQFANFEKFKTKMIGLGMRVKP